MLVSLDTMHILVLVVLLARGCSGFIEPCDIVSYLAKADNPQEAFIRAVLENVKTKIPLGIPALGIPPLEPIEFGSMHLDEAPIEGFVDLEGDVSDVVLKGLSNLTIETLKFVFLPKPGLRLGFYWQNLHMNGGYDLHGKLANSISFSGHGNFTVDVLKLNFTAYADITAKNQKFQVDTLKLDLTIKRVDIVFKNILGGGIFEGVANRFISTMAKLTFDQRLRPVVTNLGEDVKTALNELLGSM